MPACVYVYHTCTVPWNLECLRSPGTGVKSSYKQSKQGPLQEQEVPLPLYLPSHLSGSNLRPLPWACISSVSETPGAWISLTLTPKIPKEIGVNLNK